MLSHVTLGRRAAAEAVGTALLLATVIGSGIMGERLAGGNTAIVLLANSIATGAGLIALILAFGPISGAHFNPVVTLTSGLSWTEIAVYGTAQVIGAFAGAIAANAMFALPIVSISRHARQGGPLFISEIIATFGLMLVIAGCARGRKGAMPFAVGGYITAAYWFTSSTSFANPAVTLARTVSDTFTGIRPQDAPAFIGAQVTGAILAVLLGRWLMGNSKADPVSP